jgi:hypothetical protein
VGSRAVLNAVAERKIPSPRRESNIRTPIVQTVAMYLKFNSLWTAIREQIMIYTFCLFCNSNYIQPVAICTLVMKLGQ